MTSKRSYTPSWALGSLARIFSNPQRSTYFLAGINRELGKGNSLAIRYSYYQLDG